LKGKPTKYNLIGKKSRALQRMNFNNYLSSLVILWVCLCCYAEVSADQEETKRRNRRDTVRDVSRRWPQGKIPYTFSLLTGIQTKSAFRAAVKELESVSCVRFVPRTNEKDYVRIITGDGCYSLIGRDGGQQQLSLGVGCYRKGIAIHEVMHLLGFFHEQSRLDRDDHVTVNYENAQLDAKRQFKKYKDADANTLGEAYDPDSIMHYSNTAFSSNGRDTIIFKKNPTRKLGQRDHLSPIDIRQLNTLYRCPVQAKKSIKKTVVTVDRCRDDPRSIFSGLCFFNRLMNLCYINARSMSYLCPRSCGFCRPTCVDTSTYCRYFSFYGYCMSSEKVQKRCQKTCGLCKTIY